MDSLASQRLDIRLNVNMGAFTTLGAGGQAQALVDVRDLEALRALLSWCRENTIRWQVIGAGSNVLVASDHFPGIFVRLRGAFKEVAAPVSAAGTGAEVLVQVGAGYSLSRLAWSCAGKSLSGLEWAVGIPGTVGGAICMNAGAYGSTMGAHIEDLACLDHRGRLHILSARQLGFRYRKTVFPDNIVGPSPVILGTTVVLQLDDGRAIQERCRANRRQRKQKLPGGVGTAGSFFKNPSGDYAGRLIDAAGLKGTRVGDAEVSFRHANVIINRGQATATDIVALMQVVQAEVKNQSGIDLEPEVQIF